MATPSRSDFLLCQHLAERLTEYVRRLGDVKLLDKMYDVQNECTKKIHELDKKGA